MAPSPGGILYREIAPILRHIARNHRVVGMDVVEVAPATTARTASPRSWLEGS